MKLTKVFYAVRVFRFPVVDNKTDKITYHDGWFHKSEPKGNCGSGYPIVEINGGCLYTTEKNAEKAKAKAKERFGLRGKVVPVVLKYDESIK